MNKQKPPTCSRCPSRDRIQVVTLDGGALVWLCSACTYRELEGREPAPAPKDKRGVSKKQRKTLFDSKATL